MTLGKREEIIRKARLERNGDVLTYKDYNIDSLRLQNNVKIQKDLLSLLGNKSLDSLSVKEFETVLMRVKHPRKKEMPIINKETGLFENGLPIKDGYLSTSRLKKELPNISLPNKAVIDTNQCIDEENIEADELESQLLEIDNNIVYNVLTNTSKLLKNNDFYWDGVLKEIENERHAGIYEYFGDWQSICYLFNDSESDEEPINFNKGVELFWDYLIDKDTEPALFAKVMYYGFLNCNDFDFDIYQDEIQSRETNHGVPLVATIKNIIGEEEISKKALSFIDSLDVSGSENTYSMKFALKFAENMGITNVKKLILQKYANSMFLTPKVKKELEPIINGASNDDEILEQINEKIGEMHDLEWDKDFKDNKALLIEGLWPAIDQTEKDKLISIMRNQKNYYILKYLALCKNTTSEAVVNSRNIPYYLSLGIDGRNLFVLFKKNLIEGISKSRDIVGSEHLRKALSEYNRYVYYGKILNYDSSEEFYLYGDNLESSIDKLSEIGDLKEFIDQKGIQDIICKGGLEFIHCLKKRFGENLTLDTINKNSALIIFVNRLFSEELVTRTLENFMGDNINDYIEYRFKGDKEKANLNLKRNGAI